MNPGILEADKTENGWGRWKVKRVPGQWKIPHLNFIPLNVPELNMPG